MKPYTPFPLSRHESISSQRKRPIASIRVLRNAGYDVLAIIEHNPGASDQTILAQAIAENRIILTFDSDDGNLIFRDHLPAAAVVYLHFESSTPEEPALQVMRLLSIDNLILSGRFTVADRQHIRQRPLP